MTITGKRAEQTNFGFLSNPFNLLQEATWRNRQANFPFGRWVTMWIA